MIKGRHKKRYLGPVAPLSSQKLLPMTFMGNCFSCTVFSARVQVVVDLEMSLLYTGAPVKRHDLSQIIGSKLAWKVQMPGVLKPKTGGKYILFE
jgi:hypothetical protein